MQSLSFKVFISVIICLGLGLSIGYFTAPGSWYQLINKPTWQPPNWIFGPVWTMLYIMMGVAFARVWQAKPSLEKNKALVFFIIQFIFNLFWSIIFFKAQKIGFAFAEILFLWGLIILTIRQFFKIDRLAAYLLIPYCIWVSFATILNGTILLLN